MPAIPYDALIVVSFGGPESREDVIPFLENVLRGKPVPRERMLEVAEHYYHFGGVSPINLQTRELIQALQIELRTANIDLPVFWGNRNWDPFLEDTLTEMADRGLQRALALVTSAYSCYSGCRQYREDIAAAQSRIGERAPQVDKLRVFYNHPGFIEANSQRVRDCLEKLTPQARSKTILLFTAHSIPLAMAENCDYERQLRETARLVGEAVEHTRWELVYQSRSGPPQQPWLEPDVCDALTRLRQQDEVESIVIAPIGFLSDHLEVLYDLDIEAKELAASLGVNLLRAGTVGTHPRFIQMLRELVQERLQPDAPRRAVGRYGPNHDQCPEDCCLYTIPVRRPPSAS